MISKAVDISSRGFVINIEVSHIRAKTQQINVVVEIIMSSSVRRDS